MTSILVVDNYDSFVYTIVGYLDQLGARTTVVRNDAVPEPDAEGRFWHEDGTAYDGVLVSPVDREGDGVAVVDPLRDDGQDARGVDGRTAILRDRDLGSRLGSCLGEELRRPGVQSVARSDLDSAFHHDSGLRRWRPFPFSP